MTWSWEEYPPSTLHLPANSTSRITLRLKPHEGKPYPTIQWLTSRLAPLRAQVDPLEPFSLNLIIPPQAKGFYRLSFRIEDPDARFYQVIKVLIDSPEKTSPSPPEGEWLLDLLAPHSPHPLQTLHLERHRSLRIGRFSSRHERPLDLDLSAFFSSKEEEALCSREQAEFFWKDQRICIHNLGRHPLYCQREGDSLHPLYQGDTRPLSPQHIILFPGGLRFALRQKGEDHA